MVILLIIVSTKSVGLVIVSDTGIEMLGGLGRPVLGSEQRVTAQTGLPRRPMIIHFRSLRLEGQARAGSTLMHGHVRCGGHVQLVVDFIVLSGS